MSEPAAALRPKRIALKTSVGTQYDEAYAGGAISPGHLIMFDTPTADGDEAVVVHSPEGGRGSLYVALEDALQGRSIETAYAEDDVVFYQKALPGDRFFLKLAAGENASVNNPLSSNGDGNLKVAEAEEEVIAIALEDMDLSETGDVDTHMRVEIAPQSQIPAAS